jgi:MFS family permease
MTSTTATTSAAASSFGRVSRAVPMIATAAVARLPLAAFSIAVLLHVARLSGSFAAAGVACGALALAQGVGGPLLGRFVDGHGQTRALVVSSLVAAGALGALAVAPGDSPTGLLVGLAVVLGVATPPVGACLRTLLAVVVPAGDGLRRAYAADAATTELTWVSGPPLVVLAATFWDSGVALLVVAAVLVAATVRFAVLPASRYWRPAQHAPGVVPGPVPARPVGGALGSAAMRTLVLVLVGVGVLFGATEVAVTAAAGALGHSAAAGPLLGLWGVGSFAGGVAATRSGGARTGTGLAVLLAALGLGHLALVPAAGSVVALGAVITVAGAMIAPILASAYAMVDGAAPDGTVTEAFAWIATSTAIGSSAGSALAGVVVDAVSPAAAFGVAGAAAVLVALLAVARRSTLSTAVAADALARTVAGGVPHLRLRSTH